MQTLIVRKESLERKKGLFNSQFRFCIIMYLFFRWRIQQRIPNTRIKKQERILEKQDQNSNQRLEAGMQGIGNLLMTPNNTPSA
jgi:hypothetical protein